MGNSITCSMNCDCSVAAALCTVVYRVCFTYIIVSTLHRGSSGGEDMMIKAAVWLRRFFSHLSTRRPRLAPNSLNVSDGAQSATVAVLLRILLFSAVTDIRSAITDAIQP